MPAVDANVLLGLTTVAALLEFFGGLFLVLGAFGIKVVSEATAASILLAFLLPVTYIMHQPKDQNETIAMLKNLALAGALIGYLEAKPAAGASGKKNQ